MSKKAITRRILPAMIYDIAAIESWLADMAAQGLHLKKCGLFFIHFIPGKPETARFRLEPITNEIKQPADDLLNYYRENGWEYITSYGNQFYICKSIMADATELQTDPIAQSLAFTPLKKRLYSSGIIITMIIVSTLIKLFSGFYYSQYPTLLLAEESLSHISLAMLLILISKLIWIIFYIRAITRIKKQLSSGQFLCHQKDYQKRKWLCISSKIVKTSFYALFIFCFLSYGVGSWKANVEEINMPLPYLPLSVIEQSQDFSFPEPAFDYNGINEYNRVSFTKSIFTPENFSIYQQGTFVNNKIAGQEHFPYAYTKYYRLQLSFFADPLMKEVMLWHGEWINMPEIQELPAGKFDRLLFASTGQVQMLSVRQKNTVLFIEYSGEAVLTDYLEELADMLETYNAGKQE